MPEDPADSKQDDDRYEAFIQCFTHTEPDLRRFIRSLLPTWSDTDEVLQETALVASEGIDELDERVETHSALEHCLGALPPDQRKFVTLAYTPGIKVKDLAAQSGSTSAAFYMRLKRIRHKLMNCIESRRTASHPS
ncbi:MAG: DNA-directed RNA polymerase specialized sigma24 family protein [Akkermansiaceae bacterium]|jgi:DNA-directed RNA polymerase specialized sigma24 family protein